MNKNFETMRHSCSHVLAAAVLKLYPKAKLAIGPAIEEGFYYDFDFGKEKISEADLEKISSLMIQIMESKQPFKKEQVSATEARKIFKDQPFKLELIKDLEKEGKKKVSIYRTAAFVDLCAGPHVENTGKIGPFKLLSLAGAYWRGSEKNKMLTRIYGTCFPTQKELDEHLKRLEEAKKRDHKKIGRELDLFKIDEVAPGAVFWLPKGMIIFKELEKLWRSKHDAAGYQEINTPILVRSKIFETSGHFKHYRHFMYNLVLEENIQHSLKPMNCPESTLIYNSKTRSYRDLPLRFSEIGRLFRREKSGELNGLFRVRQLTMDDAHLYVTPEQIETEIEQIVALVEDFYKIFSFKPEFKLATKPKDSMGEVNLWKMAEKSLEKVLKKKGLKYEVKSGEGAFYGPKIDIYINDALERNWQMATIQLDFQMPLNFALKYTDPEGKTNTPVMIHRAIFGSFERFIGILTEHYAGAFPVWLSPVQAIIIPITEKEILYAQKVFQEIKEAGIRVELDDRNETTSAKIRDAELQKVPYMIVVGQKEEKNKSVAVRQRSQGDQGETKLEKFISKIQEEIAKKK